MKSLDKFSWGIPLIARDDWREPYHADYHIWKGVFEEKLVMAGSPKDTKERNCIFAEARLEATSLAWQVAELDTKKEKSGWWRVIHAQYYVECERGLRDGTYGWTKDQRPLPCCNTRLYIDDGSTKGVLHPDTPLEIALKLQKESTSSLEIVRWILKNEARESTKEETVGEARGFDPEQTCPQCRGYVLSGATRRRVFWSCTKCSWSKSEENLAYPP